MKIKSVIILFIMVFVVQFSAFSQFFGLSKPNSTNLVSKTNEEIAGGQFTVYQYHSSLTQSQVLQFYQDKLSIKGWSKMDLAMPEVIGKAFRDRVYNFVKGGEMLVLNFSPVKAQKRIFYSISVGNSPKSKVVGGEEEFSEEAFKEPKFLDFMPIYPGSKQVDYRKIPSGIQVGYMASGGIEAVKGFYLQRMPQQGWSLRDEKYIRGDQYDFSNIENDCPTCPKLPPGAKEMIADINMQGVFLEFKQGSKSCLINITEMGGLGEGADLTSLGLGDTIITVLYYDKK